MTTTPQDRRTAAALAFAEAVWKLKLAEDAARLSRGAGRRPLQEAEYQARDALIGAEQAWFEVAAQHEAATRPMPAEAG